MVFSPPPPPLPDTEKLIKIYLDAQEEIIKDIQKLTVKGSLGTAQIKAQLLNSVKRNLVQLSKDTQAWTDQNIPLAVEEGIRDSDEAIAEQFAAAGQDLPDFPLSFAVIDTESLNVIVRGVDQVFDETIGFTGDRYARRIDDIISTKISTGQTVKQAQLEVIKMLEQEGIVAKEFTRAGGKVLVQLAAQGERLVRSQTSEVTNLASINRSRQVGGDLVKMTSHATSCPICWPLQGRVYSISGTSTIYPPLETAFSAGFANIHPNCRHRIKSYIPALKTPEELAKDIAFSRRPLEIDNMSSGMQRAFQRNNKIYQAGQKKRADILANRYQWLRYQSRLGKPNTFSSFMRIKNENGAKWQKLQIDYRTSGAENKQELEPEV